MSIYGLNDSDRRKIAAALNLTRRQPQRAQGVVVPPIHGEEFPREIEWKNYGGSTCPPGGIIKITDYEADSTDPSWRLHGYRPDATRGNFYAVNGSTGVASDNIGHCLLFGHALAKLPDTVSQGDTVYCKTDSWDAADNGIFAIGEVLGSSVTLQVNDSGSSAGMKPILLGTGIKAVIGKLTGALVDGANTINVWTGAAGSEAVSSATITAYPWQAIGSCTYPVSTTAKVMCIKIDGIWRIMPLPWDRTAISGYSGSVVQYLKHDTSGCLAWETPEECP
jgi:hypothetical protein